jgi:hypothetical protein
MLISIVGFIDSPKGVPIPTLVSGQPYEELFGIEPLCFHSFTSGFVILGSGTSRKLGPFVLCSAIQPNDLPSDVIQGAFEVVYRIPNDQRDFLWRLDFKPYANQESPGFLISLEPKRMRISVNERIKHSLKIKDVLLGPFNL